MQKTPAVPVTPEEYRQIVNSPFSIRVDSNLLNQLKDPCRGLEIALQLIQNAEKSREPL